MIKFIENMGVYSSSNIVELKNGEIAIRFETNLIKRPKPKIIMLMYKDKKRTKTRVVDLVKMNLVQDSLLATR